MTLLRQTHFDAWILAHDLNKPSRVLGAVVQPAAAVHDMVLLQHAQATAHRGRVREHEYPPAVIRRAFFDGVFEPFHLFLVDEHFVGSVHCVSKDGRAESDQHSILGDDVFELGCFFAYIV